jgi:hypothetical protein
MHVTYDHIKMSDYLLKNLTRALKQWTVQLLCCGRKLLAQNVYEIDGSKRIGQSSRFKFYLVGDDALPNSLIMFMKSVSPWWLTIAVSGDHSREILMKWLKNICF